MRKRSSVPLALCALSSLSLSAAQILIESVDLSATRAETVTGVQSNKIEAAVANGGTASLSALTVSNHTKLGTMAANSAGGSSIGSLQAGYNDSLMASWFVNSPGAWQIGYTGETTGIAATNLGTAAVQIFALDSANQKALTTTGGRGSLLIGAGVSSNLHAVVVGDGAVSHGPNSITATGGFWGSGIGLTDIRDTLALTNLSSPTLTGLALQRYTNALANAYTVSQVSGAPASVLGRYNYKATSVYTNGLGWQIYVETSPLFTVYISSLPPLASGTYTFMSGAVPRNNSSSGGIGTGTIQLDYAYSPAAYSTTILSTNGLEGAALRTASVPVEALVTVPVTNNQPQASFGEVTVNAAAGTPVLNIQRDGVAWGQVVPGASGPIIKPASGKDLFLYNAQNMGITVKNTSGEVQITSNLTVGGVSTFNSNVVIESSSGNILTLQRGGVTRAYIDTVGNAYFGALSRTDYAFGLGGSGLLFKNTSLLGWSSGTTYTGTDTTLSRQSAGVLRVGTGTTGNNLGSLSLSNLTVAGSATIASNLTVNLINNQPVVPRAWMPLTTHSQFGYVDLACASNSVINIGPAPLNSFVLRPLVLTAVSGAAYTFSNIVFYCDRAIADPRASQGFTAVTTGVFTVSTWGINSPKGYVMRRDDATLVPGYARRNLAAYSLGIDGTSVRLMCFWSPATDEEIADADGIIDYGDDAR